MNITTKILASFIVFLSAMTLILIIDIYDIPLVYSNEEETQYQIQGDIGEGIINACNYENTTYKKVKCLHNIISSSFVYEKGNPDATLKEAMTEGGNCVAFTRIFCSFMEEINVSCKGIDIFTENGGHKFPIVYFDEGDKMVWCMVGSSPHFFNCHRGGF